MTRTLLILAAGLAAAGGCKSYERPRELRNKPRPDQPYLSIEEQKARGRARYAIPEDDRQVSPNGLIDRPSPTGR